MSNLKFKSRTTPAALDGFLGSRLHRVLGHSTTVDRGYALTSNSVYYMIEYHGNRIATIEDGRVTVSLAGWHTPTTRNRLNMILDENYIPFGVHQLNYRQILSGRDIDPYLPWRVITDEFEYATFTRIDGQWQLTMLNGEVL